ncbi:flavoprotein-like protein [Mycena galericulata]|nr:flavoprotein-like protein [Mycena galericulata]
MCFPSKKQKANFDVEEKKPAAAPAAAAAKPAAATSTAAASTAPSKEPATAKGSAATTLAEAPATGPKVAIIIYSMYGHIAKMAESAKAGIEEAGGSATMYQVAETLPQDVLDKMYAPPKPAFPIITADELAKYDAFLMGVPSRFGNFPAQWKAFWDSTGSLWASGALTGKYAGAFTSSAGPGGGQEVTILQTISTLAHHGVVFVPLGYAHAFPQLTGVEEVHGGSPWGAGTYAAVDGSRQPSPLELELAHIQGKAFWNVVKRAF